MQIGGVGCEVGERVRWDQVESVRESMHGEMILLISSEKRADLGRCVVMALGSCTEGGLWGGKSSKG